MPDVKKLHGGAPVASDILVNVDHVTIDGDGSEGHPLHVIGGGGTFPVLPTVKPAVGGTALLVVNKTNIIDLTNGGTQKLRLPPADASSNGTQLKFVFINGQDGSSIQIIGTGGDTIHAVLLTTNFSGGSGAYGTDAYTSDGASAWWEVF
jgi:hypothetical protein